ncbi:methyl-accepting chemotaxis protein [Methanogenium marinum]|uniref:Methyl-accepting chemotaxis protein n=1 Tax=Methanogenium marinum TaxID=348610 RepID=A0A9Q4PWA0_9EURY|nr:methyl-accepting chemotaxis protein [Methanogenium marinum]MDE4908424.1 methyl-accepting chemotaxis protein [Methanogenium marinum]
MSVKIIEDALRRALDGDFTVSLSQAAADPETQELVGLVETAIGKMQKSAEYQEMLRGVDEFIANYPYPLGIYAADGACLMLNDHYCDLFRDSCDSLMKKSFSDFDITVLGGDSLFASHDTKKNSETDLQVAWNDGTKNYLKLYQIPITDSTGDISVVYHIYLDQTAVIGEQEELKKLQKRADAFLMQNPQGITVLAADKHRLDLNEEYQRIWRGGYNDLMAKKLYDFNINIVGGDDFYASYETKKKAVTDMEIGWENGEKSYLRLFQTPILDENGEIDVNYYIYQDLTEQHEEMEEIKTLQRRADAFLQQNPQGITVLAADKHRLDLNEEYQRIWHGGYNDLMAKKLYDFNINIVGGDDFYASYETKKKAVTDMEISWGGDEKSYLRLFQTPILDQNGDIDVNYYIYQDLTPERALSQFLDQEITRQGANLALLAHGDTSGFDLTVGKTNEYTAEAGVLFGEMNANLTAVQKAIEEMVEDFVGTMKAMQGGDSKARAHQDQFEGVYAVIIEGLNNVIETVMGPLNESYRVMKSYADKDFSRRFDGGIMVEGDFLKLKTAINNVGVNVGSALGEVKIAVDNVDANMADAARGVEEIAKAMEDVAVNSQQSSEASRRQIEAVESVAREISDLSASIEEIASTSQEVMAQADHVSKMGNEASRMGKEANTKMNAVEKISEESVTQIEQLNKKMAEISKIVKLINDISSQTNLLALNAAIEAARAGEHGRGFAVVAGEVKNLAAESKAATDSIEELIEGIQRDSNTTAVSMKSAYSEIQASLESVHRAITSLNEIVTGAQEASEGIHEIARATDDQANATNRVMEKMEEATTLTKENMGRIDDVAAVTEEVAASTEEVGSGTYEVTRMTEKLRAMVSVFRTE